LMPRQHRKLKAEHSIGIHAGIADLGEIGRTGKISESPPSRLYT